MVINRVSISVNKEAATSTTLEPAKSEQELRREFFMKSNAAFLANLDLPPSMAEQLATKKEAAKQARILNKQNKPKEPKVAITPRASLRNQTQTSEENKSSSNEGTNNDDDDNDGDDDDDDDDHNSSVNDDDDNNVDNIDSQANVCINA